MLKDDDGDEAEVDSAWRQEIGSRVDDILSGKVEMIPYEESRWRLHARLAELRK